MYNRTSCICQFEYYTLRYVFHNYSVELRPCEACNRSIHFSNCWTYKEYIICMIPSLILRLASNLVVFYRLSERVNENYKLFLVVFKALEDEIQLARSISDK